MFKFFDEKRTNDNRLKTRRILKEYRSPTNGVLMMLNRSALNCNGFILGPDLTPPLGLMKFSTVVFA